MRHAQAPLTTLNLYLKADLWVCEVLGVTRGV